MGLILGGSTDNQPYKTKGPLMLYVPLLLEGSSMYIPYSPEYMWHRSIYKSHPHKSICHAQLHFHSVLGPRMKATAYTHIYNRKLQFKECNCHVMYYIWPLVVLLDLIHTWHAWAYSVRKQKNDYASVFRTFRVISRIWKIARKFGGQKCDIYFGNRV